MSSKENPLKDLKIKWVRGITASPFPGLSITSSARFFLLFVGQVVWMLHVLQLSSSSWWSGCACWEDVFPKQPALEQPVAPNTAPLSRSRFAACLSTHTANTPTPPPHWKARTAFFLLLHHSAGTGEDSHCCPDYVACPQGWSLKKPSRCLPLSWQY